ncbi:MAG: metallophosphoesterase, partial [Pseudomonadota bacterium]
MRIYAVGDIHGRADLLNDLLNLIADDMSDADQMIVRLVFLGDYVDRGLYSKEVIDRLVELQLPVVRRFRLIAKAGDSSLSEWDQTYNIYDKA